MELTFYTPHIGCNPGYTTDLLFYIKFLPQVEYK